jgi:hypothetical protein
MELLPGKLRSQRVAVYGDDVRWQDVAERELLGALSGNTPDLVCV